MWLGHCLPSLPLLLHTPAAGHCSAHYNPFLSKLATYLLCVQLPCTLMPAAATAVLCPPPHASHVANHHYLPAITGSCLPATPPRAPSLLSLALVLDLER